MLTPTSSPNTFTDVVSTVEKTAVTNGMTSVLDGYASRKSSAMNLTPRSNLNTQGLLSTPRDGGSMVNGGVGMYVTGRLNTVAGKINDKIWTYFTVVYQYNVMFIYGM